MRRGRLGGPSAVAGRAGRGAAAGAAAGAPHHECAVAAIAANQTAPGENGRLPHSGIVRAADRTDRHRRPRRRPPRARRRRALGPRAVGPAPRAAPRRLRRAAPAPAARRTAPATRGSSSCSPLARRACGRRCCCAPPTWRPRRRAATVLVLHDAAALRHPGWYSPAYAAWQRRLLPVLAARARRIVTVSEFSRGELAELLGADPARISVVPGGVDARFTPGADPEPARRALGLDAPVRAVRRLAHGAQEPRRARPRGARAGPRRRRARRRGRPPPAVRRRGRASAACGCSATSTTSCSPGLYAGAEAFALPSLYEGFGLPVLEAMAAGTPVVTTTAGALPETAGGAARLAEPEARRSRPRSLALLADPSSGRGCARPASHAPAASPGTAPPREVDALLQSACRVPPAQRRSGGVARALGAALQAARRRAERRQRRRAITRPSRTRRRPE